MTFGEVANTEQGVQPYKYNGKELDRTHGLNWYDYSARHYDGAYGRFTTPDPLAEKYYSISPYAYCLNNPLKYVDPTGESPAKILKAAFNVGKRAYKTYKASGKLDIGKALIQEGVNIVDNVGTLFDSDASTFDKVIAGVDLLTGFGNEVSKGAKALGVVDNATDAKKTYQTYTKTNPKTGEVYTGRTSGKGSPRENVRQRDANHHKNKEGFDKAKLDQTSSNPDAIRGREQQMIEVNGGAKSQKGTSGNAINGVSPNNPEKDYFLDEAIKEFGEP